MTVTYIYAVTLSDNENDDTQAASALTSLPEYTDLSASGMGSCTKQLVPASVRASHENGSNEGAAKAVDGDLATKWCVTNNDTPWLELTFDEEVEICSYFLMNAGGESGDYITRAFYLQRYDNGKWVDVDEVGDNDINKLRRAVTPFRTTRVRLQIEKGERNGSTTRVLEFAVYGEDDTPPSYIDNPGMPAGALEVAGNFPNPVADRTTIRCRSTHAVTDALLQVYSLTGELVEARMYSVSAVDGTFDLEWDAATVNDGLYLYRVSAFEGQQPVAVATGKMVVEK